MMHKIFSSWWSCRYLTYYKQVALRLLYIYITGIDKTWLSLEIRASLDFSDKVQRSKILVEWSNMIGYKMGSSLAMVYTTSKTSPVENFKLDEKMTWLLTWQYFLLEEVSRGQVSWATSNSLTRNLASGELQLEVIFCFFLKKIPSFPPYSSRKRVSIWL